MTDAELIAHWRYVAWSLPSEGDTADDHRMAAETADRLTLLVAEATATTPKENA